MVRETSGHWETRSKRFVANTDFSFFLFLFFIDWFMAESFPKRIFRTGWLWDPGCHIRRGHRQCPHPNLSWSVILSFHGIHECDQCQHEPTTHCETLHVNAWACYSHGAAYGDSMPNALAAFQKFTEHRSMLHLNGVIGRFRVCVKFSECLYCVHQASEALGYACRIWGRRGILKRSRHTCNQGDPFSEYASACRYTCMLAFVCVSGSQKNSNLQQDFTSFAWNERYNIGPGFDKCMRIVLSVRLDHDVLNLIGLSIELCFLHM